MRLEARGAPLVQRNLGHDMDLIVYGHAGQLPICFPSKGGRTGDWESFGMVDAVWELIEHGSSRVARAGILGSDLSS